MDNAESTGKHTIFLVKLGDVDFGLASALLLDNVYLAIGQDYDGDHESLFMDLGQATKPYQKEDKEHKYWRDYEKGQVIVWPLERRGEIIIKE